MESIVRLRWHGPISYRRDENNAKFKNYSHLSCSISSTELSRNIHITFYRSWFCSSWTTHNLNWRLINRQDEVGANPKNFVVPMSIISVSNLQLSTNFANNRCSKEHTPHDAMQDKLQQLRFFLHGGFPPQVSERLWICHYVIGSWCCNNLDGTSMSSVKHDD